MKIITGQPVDLQNATCACERIPEPFHENDSLSFQIAGTEIGDEMVINGDFAANLDDWDNEDTEWVQGDGYAVGIGGFTLGQDVGIESGKSYVLRFYALVEFYDPLDPFTVQLGSQTYTVYNDGLQEVRFTADSAHDIVFLSPVAYRVRITDVSVYALDTESINVNLYDTDGTFIFDVEGESEAGTRLFRDINFNNLEVPSDLCFQACIEYFDPYVLDNNEFEEEEGWEVNTNALEYEWEEGEVELTFDNDTEIQLAFSQSFEGSQGCEVETWATKYTPDNNLSISCTYDTGTTRVFTIVLRIKDGSGNVIATRTYINLTVLTSGGLISLGLNFSPSPVTLPADDTYTYELIITCLGVLQTLTIGHKAIVMTCPKVLCSQPYAIITDKCDTVLLEYSDTVPKLNFRFPFTFYQRFPAVVKPLSASFNRAQALLFSGRTVSSQVRTEVKRIIRTGLTNERQMEATANMLSLRTTELYVADEDAIDIAYNEGDLDVNVEESVCQLKLEIPFIPQPQNKLSRNSNFG